MVDSYGALNCNDFMKAKHRLTLNNLRPMFALLVLILNGCASSSEQKTRTITVYGFSIVKEPLEAEIFPAFAEKWQREHGEAVEFSASFAGSEVVTNQILQGVPAEIAVLSSARDADVLRQAKLVDSDADSLPNRGIVNKSPFVIVVRAGNPRGIENFDDLSKPNVKLLLPDPMTSGGGQWSLLALYGAELKKSNSPDIAREDLKAIWRNVIAAPASAREARTQFETGFGDALVTYEFEALAMRQKNRQIEIITPAATIFSEHAAAAVDRNITTDNREIVQAFLQFLWSDEAQTAFVKHNLRAGTDEKLNAANKDFLTVEQPFTIEFLGGWPRAYPEIIERVWLAEVRGK